VAVTVHTRNAAIADGFRASAEEKLVRAAKVFDRTGDIDLEVSEEHNPRLADERYRLEVTAPAAGQVIRIVASADTPEAALDLAVDRFTGQLRKLKERLIDRHRKVQAQNAAIVEAPQEAEPEVVRVKQFVMKPLTVEEAALQMEMLGHDFFFFLNDATGRQSVLYQRRDGRLGLIEPAS
jgi:putative sigma-54 modulation protein